MNRTETGWRPQRILVADRLLGPELEHYLNARLGDREIRQRPLADVLADDLSWAEVFIGFQPPGELPLDSLRWVHSTGAGVDAYLFRRPFPDGVLLTRTSGQFGERIAEYCVARALYDCQHMRVFELNQRARRWKKVAPRELRGRRVLVVGTGELGRAVATMFTALGCDVHGVSESGRPVTPFLSVVSRRQLQEVVAPAEYIVITLPLTEATFHMFDARIFGRCRGAYLINVARGKVIDHAALVEALDHGHVRGAALDVFENEPLPGDSTLWQRHDLLISPHVAALTKLEEAGETFLGNLADLESGLEPRTRVDIRRGY